MAQKPTTNAETNKYAVVTGSNKGIGFEICRKLASHGITVILTSRDEKRGLEAVEKLKKESDFSDNIIFHQLNTMDPASVKSLAEFIKSQFGKLDILVNNAGVLGTIWNVDVLKAEEELKADAIGEERDWNATRNWNELTSYTRDLTVECIETNYYSTKRITEALLPLLQLSNSPRIVNVSSEYGKLKNIPNEWAKSILKDAENLTEERIETVLNEYLKEDFKEESLEKKGWPWIFGPYKMSKAAMNAYTRILAKKYPHFRINCVCPGFVKTDMNYNTGMITVEEGVESPVKLALLPDDGPTGAFFVNNEVSSFEE